MTALTDRVLVVSLAARTDRRAALRRRWPLPGGLVFFDAFADPDDRAGACIASHVAALLSLGDDEPALILEDDAVFADGFTLDLEPPPDWDVLWLGGQHLVPPEPTDRPGWVRPAALVCHHAYLARHPATLGRLLHAFGPNHSIPAAALSLVHYAPAPFIVGQGPGWSDIDGVTYGTRFWNEGR